MGKKIPVVLSTDLYYHIGDADDHFDTACYLTCSEFEHRGILLDHNAGRRGRPQDGHRVLAKLMEFSGSVCPYGHGLQSFHMRDERDKALDNPCQEGLSLLRNALQGDGKVHVIVVGSMSDVAVAFVRWPELMRQKVARLYLLASYAGHKINDLERNAVDDPIALRVLLDSGLPITIAPCDISCWPFDFYRLVGSCNPLCDFLAKEVFWAYLVRQPQGTPPAQVDRYALMEQQKKCYSTVAFAMAASDARAKEMAEVVPCRVTVDELGRFVNLQEQSRDANVDLIVGTHNPLVEEFLVEKLRSAPVMTGRRPRRRLPAEEELERPAPAGRGEAASSVYQRPQPTGCAHRAGSLLLRRGVRGEDARSGGRDGPAPGYQSRLLVLRSGDGISNAAPLAGPRAGRNRPRAGHQGCVARCCGLCRLGRETAADGRGMGTGRARHGQARFSVGRRGAGPHAAKRRVAPEWAVGHARPGVAVDIGLVRRVATVPRVARVLCQPSSLSLYTSVTGPNRRRVRPTSAFGAAAKCEGDDLRRRFGAGARCEHCSAAFVYEMKRRSCLPT